MQLKRVVPCYNLGNEPPAFQADGPTDNRKDASIMALEYLTVEHINTQDLIRIFSKIFIHPDVTFNGTPCWLWLGNRSIWGHGSMKWGGNRNYENVYRVLYAWLIEPLPQGTLLQSRVRSRM